MKAKNCFFPVALFALAAIGGVLLLLNPVILQGNSAARFGTADDWTHHHVVFSHPGTFFDAVRSGSFGSWYNIVSDPRYVIQQMKRTRALSDSRNDSRREDRLLAARPIKKNPVKADWSMTLGSNARVGAGQFPAKYSFATNGVPNCASAATPDYVAYNTGLAGSASQASIVAFDNLYATTCTGTVPTVYWAYNTGGTVSTSPIISFHGDQVAFVQSTGGVATLVLLKWANSGGTVGAPAAITNVTNANYHACTAPCYTTITFSGSPVDTNSPPFYVYDGSDTMYAGDDGGKLHKFTNVFQNSPAPAESAANGWPVTVSASKLTGAVYDSASTLLFVGDAAGVLHSVTTTGGASQTVVNSGLLAVAGSTGIVAPPIVDSTPSPAKVYVFLGDSNLNAGNSQVFQFATNFAAANTGIQETLGTGATTTTIYAGSFDNIHYSGAGTTGNLYVCGAHTAGTAPRLFQIVMNGTFTGAVNAFNSPTSGAAACSPVTEILGTKASTTLTALMTAIQTTASVTSGAGIVNGDRIQIDSEIMAVTAGGGTTTLTVTRAQLGTVGAAHASAATVADIQDWLFLSVSALGNSTGCAGACIYNYLVTTAPAAAAATTGLIATGGTSGIVVDNTSTATGASQLYYSTLANLTTTLTAAMTAVQTTASVTTGVGIVNGDYIQIGSEILHVTAGGGTVTLTVARAQLGTAAAAHVIASTVTNFGTCATSGGAGGCAVQASQAGLL